MKRRTISFEDDVYSEIQKIRGQSLIDGKDISFNKITNDLLKKQIQTDEEEDEEEKVNE